MQNTKQKYTLKEKLDIAESISTVLMFIMAVWGTIVAYEEGFWHKLLHIVDHYHTEIVKIEHSKANPTLEKQDVSKHEKDN